MAYEPEEKEVESLRQDLMNNAPMGPCMALLTSRYILTNYVPRKEGDEKCDIQTAVTVHPVGETKPVMSSPAAEVTKAALALSDEEKRQLVYSLVDYFLSRQPTQAEIDSI